MTSLNSTNPVADATRLHAEATAAAGALLQPHTEAWAARWEQGSLEAAGDLRLAQSLNASLYVFFFVFCFFFLVAGTGLYLSFQSLLFFLLL